MVYCWKRKESYEIQRWRRNVWKYMDGNGYSMQPWHW